jgi:hypothetical protein
MESPYNFHMNRVAIALVVASLAAALFLLTPGCKRWENISAMPAVAQFCVER